LWAGVLAAFVTMLLIPATRAEFVALTKGYPYLMGFAKVAILATMGELLALRIGRGDWAKPAGLWMRAVVWGLLGMSFVIVFDVFGAGAASATSRGLLPALPGFAGQVVTALLTSTLINLCFAPTMMALHRVTDTYIDLAEGRVAGLSQVKLAAVVGRIDWYGFVSFVVVKTVPLFWIPAHTVTFLLPPEYRVLNSALLSIALGVILSLAKRAARPAVAAKPA
ncbi:MAG TPA: Mpv17/PMP22 family protein, partial [Symbiobacteriaceae bacterium]|nr:Mpv17/PMP22 family protein [Symbiobacteriaceae bacterium]